jgi:hypothetical protein
MRRRLTTNRRRWVSGTLVAAILALAVGASQGLAGAAGIGTTATARVQLHNQTCFSVDTGRPFIGKARFTLSGDGALAVKVTLNGAEPGLYEVLFYEEIPGVCFSLADLGTFKVDSSGSGSKVFQSCCYSSGSYFINALNLDNGQSNQSLSVDLRR